MIGASDFHRISFATVARPSLWYRLRYAWHMRRVTASSWSFAWDSANANDAEFLDDLTPAEAVSEEVSCWEHDG